MIPSGLTPKSRPLRVLLVLLLSSEILSASATADLAPAAAGTAPAAVDDEPATPSQRLDAVTVKGTRDAPGSEFGQPVRNRRGPQSELGGEAIREEASPLADYGTLANFTPSYVSTAPNGNSWDAAKNQTLRGFPDGQFNVTLDGIPFADPDSFGHHSTSYFPANVLGRMVVDRSPGSASDPGYATIGGSINLYSLDVPEKGGGRAYTTIGSFGTDLFGIRVNTAQPKDIGATGVLVNAEHEETAGAIANSNGIKDDFLVKSETLLAPTTRLTALYTFDDYQYDNPPNTTTTLLAQQGPTSGFGATAGLPNFYRYNFTERRTDFGYLHLESSLDGGWTVDDRLYTYSYATLGLSPLAGGDISASVAANNGLVSSSPVFSKYAQGVPSGGLAGTDTSENYRTVGNLLKVNHQDAYGTLHTGLWLDHSREEYLRNSLDLVTGLNYTPTAKNAYAGSPIVARFTSHLDTVQPFIDYDWQATEALNIRPGVRYQEVERGLDAPVIASYVTRGYDGEVGRRYSTTLPSLDAHYRFNAEFDGYIQFAKGALVPNQNYFYTSVGKPPVQDLQNGNQAAAQTSNGAQIGLTWEQDGSTLAVTAYHINFENYVGKYTPPGGVVEYTNLGSVLFRGIEFEGHTQITPNLGVAGNFSLLRATFENDVPGLSGAVSGAPQRAGDDIPLIPNYTGFLGIIYSSRPWQASLVAKFVGAEYQGKAGQVDGPQFHVAPYSYANFNIARSLGGFGPFYKTRVSFSVDNVFNRIAITDAAGPAADGSTLINVLQQRNYLLSAVADF